MSQIMRSTITACHTPVKEKGGLVSGVYASNFDHVSVPNAPDILNIVVGLEICRSNFPEFMMAPLGTSTNSPSITLLYTGFQVNRY
jgi:hypothetical protein